MNNTNILFILMCLIMILASILALIYLIAIRVKYWDDFKSKKDEKLKVGDDKNENDIC